MNDENKNALFNPAGNRTCDPDLSKAVITYQPEFREANAGNAGRIRDCPADGISATFRRFTPMSIDTPVRTVAAIIPQGEYFAPLYEEGVRPACAALGIECWRVPTDWPAVTSLGQACGAVERGDLVLAEIGSHHPQSIFLTGYAQGIGKRTLMLATHADGLLFDAARQEIILHHRDPRHLADRLKGFLAVSQDSRVPAHGAEPRLNETGRDKFQQMFGEILKAHGYDHRGPVELENEKTFILREQEMGLALVQDLSRRARELGIRLKLM